MKFNHTRCKKSCLGFSGPCFAYCNRTNCLHGCGSKKCRQSATKISRSANLTSANTIFVQAFAKETLKPGVSVLFVKQDVRSSTSPRKQASEESNKTPLKKELIFKSPILLVLHFNLSSLEK